MPQDWHIDFAASSVYYTIHTGQKASCRMLSHDPLLIGADILLYQADSKKSGRIYLLAEFARATVVGLAARRVRRRRFEGHPQCWRYRVSMTCPSKPFIDDLQVHTGGMDTRCSHTGRLHRFRWKLCPLLQHRDASVLGMIPRSVLIRAELQLRQIEIDTKVPYMFRFPFFDKSVLSFSQVARAEMGQTMLVCCRPAVRRLAATSGVQAQEWEKTRQAARAGAAWPGSAFRLPSFAGRSHRDDQRARRESGVR